MYLPNVIERVGRNTKLIDIPTKLLDERKIMLEGEINEISSNYVIQQLLWLNSVSDENIDLYIKSPGGCVYSGLAIKDVIDSISCKVNTIGLGCCASMGAYLISSGTGERRGTKNFRYMIHSVSSGTMGTVHDMQISMKETEYLQNKLMKHFYDFSKGKTSLAKIKSLCKRDKFMSPEEAIELGLLDSII